MNLSIGSGGGVSGDGGGVLSWVAGLRVGASGPLAPVITMPLVGIFTSVGGRNSVTGLKGSLSKNGNLWVSVVVLSSILGRCGAMGSLSGRTAGGPGCNHRGKLFILPSLFNQEKLDEEASSLSSASCFMFILLHKCIPGSCPVQPFTFLVYIFVSRSKASSLPALVIMSD